MPDTIGVEFELSEHNDTARRFFSEMGWETHIDASIRGNRPVEVVSSPIQANEAGIKTICDFAGILNDSSCSTNDSCGLHIHVHPVGYDWRNARALWSFMRRSGDSVILGMQNNADRAGGLNRYCRSLNHHPTTPGLINGVSGEADMFLAWYCKEIRDSLMTYGNTQSQPHRAKYSPTRYHATNLHSWWYRDTIEFRHFLGTLDKDSVETWIRLVLHIINTFRTGEFLGIKPELSRKNGQASTKPHRVLDFTRTLGIEKNRDLFSSIKRYLYVPFNAGEYVEAEIQPEESLLHMVDGNSISDRKPGRADFVVTVPGTSKYSIINSREAEEHSVNSNRIRREEEARIRMEEFRRASELVTRINGVEFRIPIFNTTVPDSDNDSSGGD